MKMREAAEVTLSIMGVFSIVQRLDPRAESGLFVVYVFRERRAGGRRPEWQ